MAILPAMVLFATAQHLFLPDFKADALRRVAHQGRLYQLAENRLSDGLLCYVLVVVNFLALNEANKQVSLSENFFRESDIPDRFSQE